MGFDHRREGNVRTWNQDGNRDGKDAATSPGTRAATRNWKTKNEFSPGASLEGTSSANTWVLATYGLL